MTKAKIDELLTKKEIRAILDYDPDTGVFRWKAIKRGRTVGSIAGGQNSRGYILIFIDGKSYRAHRLAFLYVHGYFPELIDHINGERHDNRIVNLRSCTRAENTINTRLPTRNKTGYFGICHQLKKWRSQIRVDGKLICLGAYENITDAAKAYDVAARKYHGDFARQNFPTGEGKQ